MADVQPGPGPGGPVVETSDDVPLDVDVDVAGLLQARYPEMIRLANLLGADDPEDIAQEAFARLLRKHGSLRDPGAALAYVQHLALELQGPGQRVVDVLEHRPVRSSDPVSISARMATLAAWPQWHLGVTGGARWASTAVARGGISLIAKTCTPILGAKVFAIMEEASVREVGAAGSGSCG